MSTPVFRPTYSRRLTDAPDAVADRLACLVEGDAPLYAGQRVGRHVTLAPRAGDHRVYSAHLTLECEGTEDGGSGTVVRARFHPKPAMWTLVMAVELACVTGVMIGSMWGVSQLMLGDAATAFYVVAPLLLLGLVLLAGARVAQRVDRPNMLAMRDAVDGVLGTSDQQTPPT